MTSQVWRRLFDVLMLTPRRLHKAKKTTTTQDKSTNQTDKSLTASVIQLHDLVNLGRQEVTSQGHEITRALNHLESIFDMFN